VNGKIGVLDAEKAEAIAAAADGWPPASTTRLPDRRLPDRLGHQLQHERQ
jgi:hypothetical protein